MITDNFKNKMLKAVRDSIYCFSYKVNGEVKEKYPHNTMLKDKSIQVNLLLDSNDTGKITDIKLLDIVDEKYKEDLKLAIDAKYVDKFYRDCRL